MKTIEIDDDLYHFIASQTQQIGESASDILRRLLQAERAVVASTPATVVSAPVTAQLTASITTPVAESQAERTNAQDAGISHQNDTTHPDTKQGNVFDLLSKQDLQGESSVVGRFLLILSALARAHKHNFAAVLDIKGRNRVYFGRAEHDLLEAGSSTNPKPIPNSEFWVITNSNTTRKKMMLTEAALKLGYSAEQAETIRDFL